ncbi:MAG: undecaprenyl-phosphate glucose phosphotransferase [Spirochaetia bacterium]|nr:undecaprenyl-phosphate glucose phosphotransferase [Spirochaetia bacterium]
MIRERNQTFKIGFIALDFLIVASTFSISVLFHFFILFPEKNVQPDNVGIFQPGELFGYSKTAIIIGTYFSLGLLLTISQILVFIGIDLYHPRRGIRFIKEFIAIVKGILLNFGLVLSVLFFYRGTSFSRIFILIAVLLTILSVTSGHYLFRKFIGYLRKKGKNVRHVLILGGGNSAARFFETLQRHSIYGYRVVGVLAEKNKVVPLLKKLYRGGVGELKKFSEKLKPDMIVYALPQNQKKMNEVVDYCDREGIDCRIVPDLFDLITHSARIDDLDGMPVLTIRDIPLKNGYFRFMKRSFDILFSLSVLTILSWLYLLLAFLVKTTSRGPVFFSQERVGLDRKTFQVYKFRTMKVQEKNQSDTKWGTKHDTRVTSIGKFLRKTSLDEIPQFFNVLRGDMSVVGPRPERPHFVEQFKIQYHHYMRRHSVKSGITGWAQIQGFRGDTSIQKRVEADIYYIENWSFWFDLMIILRTIPSQLKSPGE